MFTLLAPLLIVAVSAGDEVASPCFYAGNDELRSYIVEAIENNPELAARHAEWQAALERVPQVTALDNPMFGYRQFVQSDAYRFGLEIEQAFPWFGTLRARGDKAMLEADAALSQFYAARNQVIAEVKRAYFEYAFLAESINVVQSQTAILENVESIIHSRYTLGFGIQADLLRVQSEKDMLTDQLAGLEQSRPALGARLHQALGRELAEEPPFPQSAEFPPTPPPAPIVLAQIRVANPDLAAAQHMIESWDKEVTLARKMGYPEFILGLELMSMKDMNMNSDRMNRVMGVDAARMLIKDTPTMGLAPTLGNVGYDVAKDLYLRDSGDANDDISVSVKVSVPIWRKKVKAGIQEAKLMQNAAEHDKKRMTLALDSAARMALYNIQDAQRRLDFYKDVLIPNQRETLKSLQSSYTTGVEMMEAAEGGQFIDIQRTVRELLESQLEMARAARDLQIAGAELEMLMGTPWKAEDNAAD